MSDCNSIMIVEDDEDIGRSLMDILESEGYSVEWARNGAEGLDRLSKLSKPCLVLLDLLMPVMNGYAFLEHVGRLKGAAHVVVLTAMSKAGPEGVRTLKKPVDLCELLEVVDGLCGHLRRAA